jgi:hypothetical protein
MCSNEPVGYKPSLPSCGKDNARPLVVSGVRKNKSRRKASSKIPRLSREASAMTCAAL